MWESHSGGKWQTIRGRDCEITLEKRPTYCDRGNFDAKAWLKKRGQWIGETP